MNRIALALLVSAALAACPSEREYPDPAQPAPKADAPTAAPSPAAPTAPAAPAPAAPAAPAPEQPVSAEAKAEAQQLFSTLCSTCHGPKGEGDGPVAAAFPVKPRRFSDPEWQKSVTNEHIEKVIVQGGPAVGKSPLMPPNPQIAEKPEVVRALRIMVRELGGTAAPAPMAPAAPGAPAPAAPAPN